jgi:LysR family glycine cleavage system transcriptional activator
MQLPPLESLQCFVTAARTLNFRAAAQAIALSPAAFSDRIQKLEEQVGAPLFTRTTRVVRLTDAGLALLGRAEKTLLAAASCVALQRPGGTPAMDVVVGTRHELGMSWVLPALGLLREDQPSVRFHLYFGAGPDLLLRLRTLEIDCAILSSRYDDPRLDAVTLHPERYVFVGQRALLRATPLAKADDARAHTLVDLNAGLPLYRYFRDRRENPRLQFARVLRMGTIAAMRAVVLEGEGVAVLPAYYVRKDLEAGRLLPILPKKALLDDAFRLVFRSDDPRRMVYARMAERLTRRPLR